MICSACRASLSPESRFCVHCGAAVASTPVYAYTASPMPVSRVERHLQPLGILWIVMGGLPLVGWLIALPILSGVLGGLGHIHPVFPFGGLVAGWIGLVTVLVALLSGSSLLVGVALLARWPWGRMLAIVFGVLALFKIPFGTALGIYTLWVLAPEASRWEYEQVALQA